MEAVDVHRRGDHGQDRGRGGPRPHRRPVRTADARLRHAADRLRPLRPPARAAQLGVRMVALEELLRESDFISIHLPKTPETAGLIGEKALRLVKPSVRIVNAARGGMVDEAALAVALARGGSRGLRSTSMSKSHAPTRRCSRFRNVVATPHLGASTDEAQDKAGLAVARSVKLSLQGEFVPDAVNVQAGGPVPEEVRPLPATGGEARLGAFTALAGELAATLTVALQGELAEYDASVLKLAALRGSSPRSSSTPSRTSTRPTSPPTGVVDVHARDVRRVESTTRTWCRCAGHFTDGGSCRCPARTSAARAIDQTDRGRRFHPRTRTPTGSCCSSGYVDPARRHRHPSARSSVEAGVNIATMQRRRHEARGEALMTLTVDNPVHADLLTRRPTRSGPPHPPQ